MELRRVLEPGSVLHGRYRIEEALREDASGRRYTAVCSVTRKRVIVKELTSHGAEPQNRAATFRRRGEAVARLRHPALVRVQACFEDEGFYIVLDPVEGRRLSEVLEEEHVGLVQALFWIDEILALLAFLHSQTPPILARVIEPDHLVVSEEGHMVLNDVALAGFIAPSPPSRYYLAGRDTTDDPRYDLYSVGALFYTMLKLEIPAGPAVETPGRRTPAFDTLIRALVHPDVKQRYATAVDAQRALRPFRERVLRLYGPPNDGDLSNSGRRRSGTDTDARSRAEDAEIVARQSAEPTRRTATSPPGKAPATAQVRSAPSSQTASPRAAGPSTPPPPATPASASTTKARSAPTAPSRTDKLASPPAATRKTDKAPPLPLAAKPKVGASRNAFIALLVIACCTLSTWLLWPTREPTAAAITVAESPSGRSPLPQTRTAPATATAAETAPAPDASAAPRTTPVSDASTMPTEATPSPEGSSEALPSPEVPPEATPLPDASEAPAGEDASPAPALSPAVRATPLVPCVVAVDSTPPNAWVKIDGGQRVGQTPCRVTLQPRTTPYNVMISKQGYLPGSALVTTRRAQTSVKISLQPAPRPAAAPPAPVYRPAPYRPPVYSRPRPAAPPPPRSRERIQLPD